MMYNVGMPGFFGMVLFAALIVLPFYQIWQRTGHNGWLSLLMIVPFVNVVALYVLAFKEWPVLADKP